MKILGIETSCDETSVALVEDGARILDSRLSSQAALHGPFGGVVPELASRAHLENLLPLLEELLGEPGLSGVDAVAFTRGPGLIGALLVGAALAKAISFALGLPLVGVNHLKAHLYSACLRGQEFEFPLVGLVVSGGHTLLIEAFSWDRSRVLGTTRDDAAGEAFDKVACLLGLGYPGGPPLEKAAGGGNPGRFKFPRGMGKSGDLDFSFSGLKTAVRQAAADCRSRGEGVPAPDIAASFQEAVVDILLAKLSAAVASCRARTVALGGGVICNRLLRSRLQAAFPPDRFRLLIPPPELCSDNAAMVAGLAYHRLRRGLPDPLDADPDPGLAWGEGLF